MALIECKDLTLSYENNTVIEDLSFSVERGDYLCIVGENGSGKSTLIRALLSLKRPTRGNLIYGDGLARRDIGYLPQQTEARHDFPASVREIVLSGCEGRCGLRPFYNRNERKSCLSAMEKLGIAELAEKSYSELSGGQQQRVLLARALCATSRLLLLDEPVSGLDPVVTAELYRLIDEINRDGIAIIMVSHDITAALSHATHILSLSHDSFFFGNTEEYKKSAAGSHFSGGEANA